MRNRQVTTHIDTTRCTGCGRCVQVCPKETLSMAGDKAVVSGNESMHCDHCAAVCPEGAIRVNAVDASLSRFDNFETEAEWLPYGEGGTSQLVRLMRSRRSCRNFRQAPVSLGLLQDLVKVGITAPSGSNHQPWTFTLLPDRAQVEAFAQRIAHFFEKLNRTAEKGWLRLLLRWCGQSSLSNYYRDHHATVKAGLDAWRSGGRDLLFHGAPAVIVVAADKSASCPAEDALLAAQNMLLAAHTLGLGTCLVGFAVEALRNDASLRSALEIPAEEAPHAVIALGWPRKVETYSTLCGRLPVTIRQPNLVVAD
ncbi:MAG: nitroreductase family protein [Desulfosarcinaceae bacterium]|nr:nitroreductase family protein [Desulfosarcinaceae bacterium]